RASGIVTGDLPRGERKMAGERWGCTLAAASKCPRATDASRPYRRPARRRDRAPSLVCDRQEEVSVTQHGPGAGPKDLWDRAHARRARSATLTRIHREVYSADYFEDAVPNSFYYGTLSDLRRVAHELRVGKDHTVVDLGCGGGAPTVWVARETGA